MNLKRFTAATALAGSLAFLVPAAPALANGAASTRNIILGIGAATYLIVNHNRKVHQRYAEYRQQQAQTAQERDNAWAAYSNEKAAYEQEAAANADLRKEVAYQHHMIVVQRQQLAMSGRHNATRTAFVANERHARSASPNQVASVSYGWGQI